MFATGRLRGRQHVAGARSVDRPSVERHRLRIPLRFTESGSAWHTAEARFWCLPSGRSHGLPEARREAASSAMNTSTTPYGPRQPVAPLFLSQERGMHALDPSARLGMPSRPMAYRPDAKPWPKRSLRAAPMLIESARRDAAPKPR